MVTTEEFQTEFISVACKYGLPTKRLSYGTAGFRDQYTILHSTFVRMGILASLRSLQLNNSYTNNVGKSINYSNNYSVGKQIVVGLMITASHNAEIDNGIKLVDSDGGMLAQSWEPYAELLANSTNNTIYDSFLEIIKKKNIDISTVINRIANSNSNSMKPLVLIGRDTRPHSYEMAQCVREGVELFGNYSLFDLGEVTTPQLHYIVDYINSSSVDKEFNRELLLSIYYESLCNGYTELISTAPIAPLHLVVDASFGVGSIALEKVCEQLETLRCNSLTIDIRNKAYAGKVNDNCGAELVQKNQVPPCGLSKDTDGNKLMCSFDGDGDRIVFHAFVSNNNQESWILLDGDKIAAIFALLISQELEAAELASYNFSVGVVQTAYANVASTSYLNRKNIKTVIAKTGVKYVEHKALEYDVGIYFEANGHGTVKFSRNFIDIIANLSADIGKEKENRRSTAIFRLKVSSTCTSSYFS